MNSQSQRWRTIFEVGVLCCGFLALAFVVGATAAVESSDNQQFLEANAPGVADLHIVKTVNPDTSLSPGGTLTYTIVLDNSGQSAVTGVVMTDQLPIEVGFGQWIQQNGASQVADLVSWTGDVGARTKTTMAFTATLGSDPDYMARTVTNTAVFSSENAGSGSFDAVFTFGKPPNLHTSKKTSSMHEEIEPGQLITYTISLSNTGGLNARTLVTDVLGPYYTVHDAMDFEEPSIGTLTWGGLVTADHFVTLQFVAKVEPRDRFSAGQTILENSAQIDDGVHDPFTVPDSSPPWVKVPGVVHLPLVLRNYFNDPFEPNDTVDEACGPLASGYSYIAYIPNETDMNDYYYIDVATTDPVQVQLIVPEALDLDLWIYDAAQDLIGGSAQDGFGIDEEFSFVPSAGSRFYIRIYRYDGWSTMDPYTLVATFD